MPGRLKVYLETSVISYLVARPSADPEKAAMAVCTRRFMDEYAPGCDIFTNEPGTRNQEPRTENSSSFGAFRAAA